MKIWRVDHITLTLDGVPIGPYMERHLLGPEHAKALTDMAMSHTDDDHRSPHLDSRILDIFPEEYCGFTSEEALYEWFANWTAALDAAGFLVRTYEVPRAEVRCGANGQVVFTMGAARLLTASRST